jgi:catechol 2,3-dioxygenase-like lactoylglutathione lyase family enzyme
VPQPGGWNRISLRVDDLAARVQALHRQGARFLSEIAAGVAVSSVLLADPAGNQIELFEPRAGYHGRDAGHEAPSPDDPATTTQEDSS